MGTMDTPQLDLLQQPMAQTKQIQLPILQPAQGVAVLMVSIIRMKTTAQNTISVIMEIILISSAALDSLGIPTVKLVTGIPTLIAVTDNALAPAKCTNTLLIKI